MRGWGSREPEAQQALATLQCHPPTPILGTQKREPEALRAPLANDLRELKTAMTSPRAVGGGGRRERESASDHGKARPLLHTLGHTLAHIYTCVSTQPNLISA